MNVINAFGWWTYGIFIKNYWTGYPCIFGFVLSLYFVLVCFPLASRIKKKLNYFFNWIIAKQRKMILIIILTGLGLTMIIAGVCLTTYPTNKNSQYVLGSMCVTYVMVFYASPLSAIRFAILQKDASVFDTKLALACIANSIVWLCYGLFINDFFVWSPCVVGICSGVTQLCLKIVYRKNKFHPMQSVLLTNPEKILTPEKRL